MSAELCQVRRYIGGRTTMRYSISRTANTLSVIVPRRFSLLLCLFIPLWFGAWVTLAVLNPAGKPQSVFLLLFFGLLSIAFAYRWLWNLAGREELEFTTSTLTSRPVLLGLSRTKVFQMDNIAARHLVTSSGRGPMSGRTPGGLAFSYEGKKFRLCDHVTQAEATALVSEVLQQFPRYAECWSRYDQGTPDCESDVPLSVK
jgi:hypothetical protein